MLTTRAINKPRNDLELLLDIVNIEAKAFVSLNLSGEFQTIVDVRDKIFEGYLDLKEQIDKRAIYSYLRKVLAEEKRGLLEEAEVSGRRNKSAKAWRLTGFGDGLTPVINYMMCFLPVNYDISSFAVIGAMNSPYEKRASYARIKILRELAASGKKSLKDLSNIVEFSPTKTQEKLENLMSIIDIDGNTMPFAVPAPNEVVEGKYAYLWTGKRFAADDFRSFKHRHSNLRSLLDIFSEGGTERVFDSANLLHRTDYRKVGDLDQAIITLEERGYIKRSLASELRNFEITAIGLDYVQRCINVALGFINGDAESIKYVLCNLPSEREMVRSVNVYTKYRILINS